MMKNLSGFILALSCAVLFTGVLAARINAEVIQIPVGSQGNEMQTMERPHNGQHRDEVLARLGEPVKKTAAVGDPPISSWEYEHFTVYFEYDLVLTTVIKHHPQGEAQIPPPATE